MLEEEKSWWKKKGFYTCACVMLIGVMAVGAVVFRNAKMKNSGQLLAEIEKEIPDSNPAAKGEKNSGRDSLAASAKVTPLPTVDVGLENKVAEEEKKQQEERKRKEEAEKKERERQEKIKKAARKEAAAVSAKVTHTFDEEKGLLWPVTGEVLLKYSMDKTVYFKTLAQYKYNPGLFISAKEGTDVKAAADGKVTEIKKEDDHGMTIKMDLGNDYMVMYGQLADVKVKSGDEVKEGDVIAKISEPTKYFLEEGTHLYFQVNQGKETVDPMLLLR